MFAAVQMQFRHVRGIDDSLVGTGENGFTACIRECDSCRNLQRRLAGAAFSCSNRFEGLIMDRNDASVGSHSVAVIAAG
jgi:hypothetical protein